MGLIVPVGKAFSISSLSYFYRPSQILELKSKLGITIENTNGLLHEEAICKLHFSNIRYYRKKGIIKPFGYGMTGHGVGPFYHPKQIAELKRKMGITLENTKGLLNEAQFKKTFGSCAIKKYREKGFIKPAGFAMTLGGRVSAMYHPRQIKELKAKLQKIAANKAKQ